MAACDKFVFLDVLRRADNDGWANLGSVGSYVVKQAPSFDSRNWGYAKLVDLVTAIELFEVDRQPGQGVQVREKPKAQQGSKKAASAKVR